eukprot:CAMPEP_0174275030 /NCGR_PEP_ID=MMETSP0439-20130205/59607_1 /TAXON_ID=0 /ORGANISM="Stereomyxa ramosa, Strain Chinc5" /LENGTH=632 /DNA_ID=CAMNT_0015367103 /DNA_START=46 /DNA_END=1944 /DNA_ORIENTATION=+
MEELEERQKKLELEIQSYSMPGVLGFLQNFWFEKQDDKENWERERVELKQTVETLQVRCKVLENIQTGLLRRIKMLEYALVQERAKYSKEEGHVEPSKPKETGQFKEAVQRPEKKTKGILEKYLQEYDKRTFEVLSSVNDYVPTDTAKVLRDLSSLPLPSFASVQNNIKDRAREEPHKTQPTTENGIGPARLLKEKIDEDKTPSAPGNPFETVQKRPAGFKLPEKKDKRKNIMQASKMFKRKSSDKRAMKLAQEKLKESSDNGSPTNSTNDSLYGLDALENDLKLEVPKHDSLGTKVGKVWQPVFTLRHHLDVVRSVSFHEEDPILMSAGDDSTVCLWNWRSAVTIGFSKAIEDVSPAHVYRGHVGPIFSCIMLSSKERAFSAGADGDIRLWILPKFRELTPYTQRGTAISLSFGVLQGHSDCIWDLSVHSTRDLILSSSSDGTVKLWDYKNQELENTFAIEDVAGGIPTSVSFVPNDVSKFIVGCTTSELQLYDITDSSKPQIVFKSPYDKGDRSNQINKIAVHPTQSLTISAHEDKTIKFWDHKSGKCIHSMVGHQTGVSDLSIDPNGNTVLTAGHGCSLRFWDIQHKNCLQELHTHRKKWEEGICTVAYHPSLDLVASGGGDSTIKVFQ